MKVSQSTDKILKTIIGVMFAVLFIILVLVLAKEILGKESGGKNQETVKCTADTEEATQETQQNTEESLQETEPAEEPAVSEAETVMAEDSGNLSEEEQVKQYLEQMTLEEKVAQVFMVTPEALTGCSPVTAAGEVTKAAYQNRPVGGIVLMEPNLTTEYELRNMTQNLHTYSKERIQLPVLIGLDEEGGTVLRIANNSNFSVPIIGDMSGVGATGDASQAYQVGDVLGTYLKDFGIDIDFAPVADVWWNQQNTVVARRSFGGDAALTADMVVQELTALQKHQISATLKHFPGHGGTAEDSHQGFASNWETMEQIQQNDLVPFQKGIDAGVDLVMVGHICTPSVEGGEMPATLSQYWITDVLKKQMGFDGMVITDAMNMSAISQNYTSAEACIRALNAGVDMLLMPQDFESAYQGVLQAVQDGRIESQRLDDAVSHIIKLKLKKMTQGR